jgi:23S rRNA pseudouridine1911/1915/1917 synthase
VSDIPEILYEDNHLIIINKKAGTLVQGDKTGDVSLDLKVKEYIRQKYDKPGDVFLGVTHRIDRPTSGIVIFARTSKALARMNEIFKNKEIKKIYWAITSDIPEKQEGKLEHFLVRNQTKNKSFASNKEEKYSKLAVLNYKFIKSSDNYHLAEIEIITGRHHQIRTQLSKIGCPIKGDLKYGAKRSNKDASISLHARRVEFMHPVKKEKIIIEAPVPKDQLWSFFSDSTK